MLFKKYLTVIKTSFLFSVILGISTFLCFSVVHADQDLISLFPIENYNQNLDAWINPNAEDYDKPLLSAEMQQLHMNMLYNHYFGNLSPWDANYVNQLLHKTPPDDLLTIEQSVILKFSNHVKLDNSTLGYGENFRPYTQDWINNIVSKINLAQFQNIVFHSENRAIAIDNLQARALPTNDVYFYSYKLAGQGYPFDNMQVSSVWIGTPLYVLGETQDHSWSLVVTPEFIAWVKTKGLARADESFVNRWKTAAKKNMVAIIRSETPISDGNGQFRFTAYIGSFFPAESSASGLKILLPLPDTDHRALIQEGSVSPDNAVLMPLLATPHHFSKIMSSLIGRPYGWGGMYFYNDCSAELKYLLTPFGIWLPRHSSHQVYSGKLVDMTAAPANQRLAYLMEKGHRFLTLVYIGGHIILYIGNAPNPNDRDHGALALTYQNMWGLSPNPPTRRAVIGKAVVFPMLLQYPEDSSLTSLANKPYFQISYLDELPNFNFKLQFVDLRTLMNEAYE